MKLIIDIDENVYKAMKTTYLNSYPQFDGYDMCVMSKKVREGTPLQEELEEIKAEIRKQSLGEWYVGRLDGKSENVTTIESIDRIIDKRISELKGENNE